VVGVGGLGVAAAVELASGGVERIGLVDGDRVELSNLHRQLLHGAADIGRPKAVVAAEKLVALRPALHVEPHVERITAANATALLGGYDFVIDATDDTLAKFLLNDVCVRSGKPLVYAGVVGLRGQLLTILPHRTACLRCLFPEPPSDDEVTTCQQAGILGPLAALIGALEAREAVSYLTGASLGAAGRLLTIDAATLRVRAVAVPRADGCPLCREPIGPLASEPRLHSTDPQSKEMS